MDEPEQGPIDSSVRVTLRRIAVGLSVPLLAAAVLWWISGTDMGRARWISIAVIVLALGGWYLSRDKRPR